MNIFITGISSGIGRSLTIQSIKQGYTVWGIARNGEVLKTLQTELGSDHLFVSQCDLGKMEDMQRVAEEMKSKNFLPDVVVLNAAMNESDTAGFDFDKYHTYFDVNLFGAMFWVEQFMGEFLKRGTGQFIAISSTSAFRKGPGGVAYSASKAALSISFRRLRTQHREGGVKFSTVYFGPINTKSWDGPKPKLFVPSENKAARYIMRLFRKTNGEYFFPFFTTTLARISSLFPESFIYFCTKRFTR